MKTLSQGLPAVHEKLIIWKFLVFRRPRSRIRGDLSWTPIKPPIRWRWIGGIFPLKPWAVICFAIFTFLHEKTKGIPRRWRTYKHPEAVVLNADANHIFETRKILSPLPGANGRYWNCLYLVGGLISEYYSDNIDKKLQLSRNEFDDFQFLPSTWLTWGRNCWHVRFLRLNHANRKVPIYNKLMLTAYQLVRIVGHSSPILKIFRPSFHIDKVFQSKYCYLTMHNYFTHSEYFIYNFYRIPYLRTTNYLKRWLC